MDTLHTVLLIVDRCLAIACVRISLAYPALTILF